MALIFGKGYRNGIVNLMDSVSVVAAPNTGDRYAYACAHTKSFDRCLCVFGARRRVVTFDEKALSAAAALI
ncbi:MAG: hypothetical protein VXX79_21385 [Pseudomonadota bacterium]|nr:hypothetical protein [Pseudomonadota bacterium]